MAAKDDYLMDTLIDMGLITQEQVDEASGEVTDTHGVILRSTREMLLGMSGKIVGG